MLLSQGVICDLAPEPMLATVLYPWRERMVNSLILALQEALAQPEGKEALVVRMTLALAVALVVAVVLFRKSRILS